MTDARRLAADPQDLEQRFATILRRFRRGERSAPLELLRLHAEWRETPAELQDLAIAAVARRVNPMLELVRVEVFTVRGSKHSRCFERCDPDSYGHKGELVVEAFKLSTRIAVFRHREAGLEFSLCPGRGSRFRTERIPDGIRVHHTDPIRPLLVARAPLDELVATPAEARRLAAPFGRLPSFEELDHVRFGGARTVYPWGDDPEGSCPANAFGVAGAGQAAAEWHEEADPATEGRRVRPVRPIR